MLCSSSIRIKQGWDKKSYSKRKKKKKTIHDTGQKMLTPHRLEAKTSMVWVDITHSSDKISMPYHPVKWIKCLNLHQH